MRAEGLRGGGVRGHPGTASVWVGVLLIWMSGVAFSWVVMAAMQRDLSHMGAQMVFMIGAGALGYDRLRRAIQGRLHTERGEC